MPNERHWARPRGIESDCKRLKKVLTSPGEAPTKSESTAKSLQAKIDEQQERIEELEQSLVDYDLDIGDLERRLEANTKEIPAHLRDETITANLAAEPDRDQASSMLERCLQTVVGRVLPPQMAVSYLTADVKIAERDKRIMPGDWLKKDATLATCVGVREFMNRRVVSEWDGLKWGKEHVVFSEHDSNYRVITEEAARELAPSAFEKGRKVNDQK